MKDFSTCKTTGQTAAEAEQCNSMLDKTVALSISPHEVLVALRHRALIAGDDEQAESNAREWATSVRRFQLILNWCVPLKELEQFAVEMGKTPAVNFVPTVIKRYSGCKLSSDVSGKNVSTRVIYLLSYNMLEW
jgi:hypothetical protein